MTGEIKIESGISELRDRIQRSYKERAEFLKDKMASGLPSFEEYRDHVGRVKELGRCSIVVDEILSAFQGEDPDEDLEEL